MPIHLDHHPSKPVLHTRMTGTVTLDEMRAHFARVRERGGQSIPEMIDARSVDGIGFNARDLLKLSSFGRTVFSGAAMAPRAFIVSHVVLFGMARVFAAVSSGWVQISVFDDAALAEAWISQFEGRATASASTPS